jgi:hypothetical protein
MNVSHNNTLSVGRVNDYIILNTNRLVFNLVGFFFLLVFVLRLVPNITWFSRFFNLDRSFGFRLRLFGKNSIVTYVFNATFNIIAVILGVPMLSVNGTLVPMQNLRPAKSHLQLYYIILCRIHLANGGNLTL